MPTVIYSNPTDRRVLPVYQVTMCWDSAITGEGEDTFLTFRLLGEESQVTLDGIFRPENGGNRLIGYKAVANIYLTEGYLASNHIERICTQRPTRFYVDLRPYKTEDPSYSLRILDLSEYDSTPTKKTGTSFSWQAHKQETTKDIYKTNIQVSCLYAKGKFPEFIDTL